MLQAEIDYLRSQGIPIYISEDRDLTQIYDQPGVCDLDLISRRQSCGLHDGGAGSACRAVHQAGVGFSQLGRTVGPPQS